MALRKPEDRIYFVAEFRVLVEESDTKYEYFDGRVYEWQAMAGTSDPHSKICANPGRRLDDASERDGTGCTSLTSDAYVAIREPRRYRLPDVTVQCGAVEEDEDFPFAHKNPTLLTEVISESSREADQGPKFREYATLPALRDYVLFEQGFPQCRVHSRNGPEAPRTLVAHFHLDAPVYFPSLDVSVPLREFYRDLR